MASSTAGGHFLLLALLLLSSAAYGQLSENFYDCPSLDKIISDEVSTALSNDPRMGASLLRLFFHDCFVQGCDASVLLDDVVLMNGTKMLSEKSADPNANSLRGFKLIDQIKIEVEKNCRKLVSCADILALAARAAVVALKGPSWPLRLGRRDSMTPNHDAAKSDLPSPGSDLDALIAAFKKKGFNEDELVALSGAHTIGLAKCQFADPNKRQARCSGLIVGTASLDKQTPEVFDNRYYGNLRNNSGLLHSDQVLTTSGSNVTAFVDKYNNSQDLFFEDFKSAMTKMSELSVLTGTSNGQVRTKCNRVN